MMKLLDSIVSFFKNAIRVKSSVMKEETKITEDIEEFGPNVVDENIITVEEPVDENSSNKIYEEGVETTSSEVVEVNVEEDKPVAPEPCINKETIHTDKVFLSTLQNFDKGYVIGASMRGRSHEIHNTPCQDYHSYEMIMDGWYILAVSDGAGSAKYAARGSKANSTFSVRLVKQMLKEKHWIENGYFPTELEWYIEARSIFEKIKLIIRTKVSELEEDCTETDFNATLMLALITPKGVLSAHVGDGRMGYLSTDDGWKSMMTPHKGEEANQTLFLQSGWTVPSVPAFNVGGIYVPETFVLPYVPQAVVLMSDGCERASWECSIMDVEQGKYIDRNLPHAGFMNPLVEALNDCQDEVKMQLFVDILDHGTTACERELDDKTMLLAIFR